MTRNYYRTGNYNTDPTRFGGIIYYSDFNTDFRGKDNTNGSEIARRIMSDRKFDMQCKRNIENNKSRNKKEVKGE